MARPPFILDSQNRQIVLRPETPDDNPFILEVYATMMVATLMLETTGITQEQFRKLAQTQVNAQKTHYSIHYPTAEYSILLRDGVAAGRLIVVPMETEIVLADIMILPQFKRQGTCTAIMRYYVGEGLRTGKKVRLSVEKWNTAMDLYCREGFVVTSESETHYFMHYNNEAAQLNMAS